MHLRTSYHFIISTITYCFHNKYSVNTHTIIVDFIFVTFYVQDFVSIETNITV